MIDPNWELVDLDPYTWRAIGKFFPPGQYIRAGSPDEHALYVLHDGGAVLNVVDSNGGRRQDLEVNTAEAPSQLAHDLYARGEWDRVHVIDRAHLESVAATAQDSAGRSLQLDQYYRRVAQLVWGDGEGYVAVPTRERTWNGWTYEAIEQKVARIREPASVALAVIDDEILAIGLIAEIIEGMIRKVTTFDAVPPELRPSDVSDQTMAMIWSELTNRFHPPAVALLCTQDVFDRWITQPDKSGTIWTAVEAGQAFVRQRSEDPLFPSSR